MHVVTKPILRITDRGTLEPNIDPVSYRRGAADLFDFHVPVVAAAPLGGDEVTALGFQRTGNAIRAALRKASGHFGG
jgi:hypothetical protein